MEHVVMATHTRLTVLDFSAETDRRPRCAPSVGVWPTLRSANREMRHNHYDRRHSSACPNSEPTFRRGRFDCVKTQAWHISCRVR